MLTFLGEQFIKGYRIQEYGPEATLILSLKDINNEIVPYSEIQADRKLTRNYNYLPKFKIVLLQYDKGISEDRDERVYIYKKLKRMCDFL